MGGGGMRRRGQIPVDLISWIPYKYILYKPYWLINTTSQYAGKVSVLKMDNQIEALSSQRKG